MATVRKQNKTKAKKRQLLDIHSRLFQSLYKTRTEQRWNKIITPTLQLNTNKLLNKVQQNHYSPHDTKRSSYLRGTCSTTYLFTCPPVPLRHPITCLIYPWSHPFNCYPLPSLPDLPSYLRERITIPKTFLFFQPSPPPPPPPPPPAP